MLIKISAILKNIINININNINRSSNNSKY